MRASALLALMPIALATASCGGGGDASDAASEPEAATPTAQATPTPDGDADESPRPAAFAMCASCHQVEPGKHGVGPSLAGVFGARAGHAEGYGYSEAMKGSGLTWDEATLDRYLTAPMQAVPGTKMTFAGLKDEAQRKEVIAYLKGL
jgi:cytochrome c